MATLWDKGWVKAFTNRGGYPNVNPAVPNLDPKHVNTEIVEWIEWAEAKDDYDLAECFLEGFRDWTIGTFNLAHKNIRKELKKYLQFRGVQIESESRIPISQCHGTQG